MTEKTYVLQHVFEGCLALTTSALSAKEEKQGSEGSVANKKGSSMAELPCCCVRGRV
jgi:hypothetical protein